MATYYNDAGKKLTGDALKKALKKGTAYTKAELEAKYNGFDIGIIKKAGSLRRLLLEAPNLYQQLSEDDLRAKAAAQAELEASNAKVSADTLYNNNRTLLENQLSGLDQVYQPQIQNVQKQTAQNVDSLQGTMLSRGLGRSSYAGALQQATQQAGSQAVSGILNEKGLKQQELGNQLTTLGTNYNTAISAIDQNRSAMTQSAFDALKQQDYEKYVSTQDARSTFLWNLLNQQKKKVSSSGGGSSSSSRSSSSSSSSNPPPNNSSGGWLQDLINGLLGR